MRQNICSFHTQFLTKPKEVNAVIDVRKNLTTSNTSNEEHVHCSNHVKKKIGQSMRHEDVLFVCVCVCRGGA